MADDLALNIPINADVNPLEQAMQRVKSSVSNATAGIKDVMGAAGIAAGAFLKSSIDIAAAGQQNFANLEQTIKSTGGAAGYTAQQIQSMSKELANTTTFSAGEILKGQNMLLTFTNIQGKVFKDASSAMLDLSQKMGTAPQQTAIQLGKALNDPVKGITALTRVGVTFTAQQKEQIKAMEDAGNAAGAQEVIIKELNKEFGGQASAQLNTYAGQMKLLQNQMTSIKGTIGSVLIPYLTQFAKVLNSGVQSIANFTSAHKTLVAAVLSITAVFGTLVGGLGLFEKVSTILGPAVSGITGLISSLSAPILIVVAAIAALTLAYTKNFGGIKTVVDGFVNKIKNAFSAAQNAFNTSKSVMTAFSTFVVNLFGTQIGTKITQVVQNIVGKIKTLSDGFKTFFSELNSGKSAPQAVIDGLSKIMSVSPQAQQTIKNLGKIFNDVANGIQNAWPTVQDVISTVFNAIAQIWNGVLYPILKIILKTFGDIVSWIVSNWPTISNVINTVFSAIQAVWESVLKPVLNFVIQTASQVVSWFVANWPLIEQTVGTVINVVKSIIQTGMEAIKPIWQTAWNIISNVLPPIWETIKAVVTTAINAVEDVIKLVMDVINGNWGAAWHDLVNLVSDIFSGAVNIISGILDTIGGLFKGIGQTALDWGKDMMDNFISGIKEEFGPLGDAVGWVANEISSMLHHSKPDKGPLADDDTWMPDFMQSLADGINGNMNVMDNAILAVSNKLVEAVTPERNARAQLWKDMASGSVTVEAALQKLAHENDMLGESTGDATEDLRNMLGEMTNISTESVVAWNAYKKLSSQLGENDDKTQQMLAKYNEYQKQYADMAEKVVEAQQKMNDAQQKTTDTFISNVNNLADKLKDALKKNYDYEKSLDEKSVTDYRDAQLKKIDAQMDALDKQQQAHDEAEEDADNAQKENDIRRQLNMSVGRAKRAELQSQLNDLLKEDDDRHYKESIDAQKEALQQQADQVKSSADTKLQNIDNFYSQQTTDAQLAAQAQKMIIDNNQKDIISLLQKYGDDYEITGQSIGERFANAFSSSIDTINNNFFTPLYAKLSNLQSIMSNVTSGNINVDQRLIAKTSFSQSAIDTIQKSLTTKQPSINVSPIMMMDGKAVARGVTNPLDITQGNNLAIRSRRVGVI
jgi:phage-related protein